MKSPHSVPMSFQHWNRVRGLFVAVSHCLVNLINYPSHVGELQSQKGSLSAEIARMEYDLIRLFDHPIWLADFIPAAVVTFGTSHQNQAVVEIQWRRSVNNSTNEVPLTLKWDIGTLKPNMPLIGRQIQSLRERNEDQGRRVELAAIVVAVAVMAHIEPDTQFTCVSSTGSRHDYYLNETRDEMIEIAGRWEGGLPGLFDEKRNQSDLNPTLRKRWVSVTIARQSSRNRTEGLHT